MATTITTSQTTLAKVGKKVQGEVLYAFAKRSEMWGFFKQLPEQDWELRASQREVTTIADLVEQPSGAFINEGEDEANAKTVAPIDLTFPWVFYNDRYSFSRTSEHLDRRHRDGQLVKQATWQTKKLMEGLVRRVGIGAFGVSTGELCQTTTAATQSSGTYVLANGFGVSGLGDAAYLSQFFKVGDYVALVRSGSLVTNAIGNITAVSASNGITVTWAGSVTSVSADSIVLANAYPTSATATLAGATEYNKAPHGLIDMTTTASLHGQSSASYALWAAGTDATAAYFTGTMAKKGQHTIKNRGGGTLNQLITSQGVERGVHLTTSSAVQFNDPLNMDLIGNVKTKGIMWHVDPLCPPNHMFGMDKKASVYKWTLTEMPSGDESSVEGSESTTVDKLEGKSGSALSFDFLYNMLCKNRANLYKWSALLEA